MNSPELDRYLSLRSTHGAENALKASLARLASRGPPLWSELGGGLLRQNAFGEAGVILEAAVARFPANSQFRIQAARARLMAGAPERAETLVREAIAREPANREGLWLLADIQRSQGRMSASAETAKRIAGLAPNHAETVVACIEWMVSCNRESEALGLAEQVFLRRQSDARVAALAAQLSLVHGRFAAARRYCLAAIDSGIDLDRWFLLQVLSMAQRYTDRAHPDLPLFENALADARIRGVARASAYFALAKLFADVEDYPPAAAALREANLLCRRSAAWSASAWKNFVDARLKGPVPVHAVDARPDFVPVFIVGLPRSGTSLVAERLNRNPLVCNRGESGLMPYIADKVLARSSDPSKLKAAEHLYYSRIRQDDAPAHIYVDKNPVNFRYLDCVAQLFPQARIIHCRRNLRDTALSAYSQYFGNPANGFSNSFGDIAAYADGATRLMDHWSMTLELAIYRCDYEQLVETPDVVMRDIRDFVGLNNDEEEAGGSRSVVATASAWQARQPIHRASIGRWRLFAPHLPEMLEAIPDPEARA